MSTTSGSHRRVQPRRRLLRWVILGICLVVLFCAGWIGVRAVLAKSHLDKAVALATDIEHEVAAGDAAAAKASALQLAENADAAHRLTGDPIWRGAEILPLAGSNLKAVDQVSAVLADVSNRAIVPITGVAGTIDLSKFKPIDGAIDLQPLAAAQPVVASAALDLRRQLVVARSIDDRSTVSPIAHGVQQLVAVLTKASGLADSADNALTLAPQMLGASGARNYLVLFQNNAELRSSGGITGALALVHTDHGRITLVQQASSADFTPAATPVFPLPPETEGLYGAITGQYIQDVNLTPNFNLAATLASAMWQKRFGTSVDGVLSMDPVALSYLLNATGPIALPTGDTLTSQNAVATLLSETYARYPNPKMQDLFFAGAAASVFQKVSSGGFAPQTLVTALSRAAEENRLLLWSSRPAEQKIIDQTSLSGALPTSSPTAPTFGVYFNDSTGAKMDYYLKSEVSTGHAMCRKDGRPTWFVRIALTNTAPLDAAKSLPRYVTGGGDFGVAPGNVQTTVSIYAPKTGVFLGATQGDVSQGVHTATDSGYPVAQYETTVSPGQTSTWTIQFLGPALKSGVPTVVQTPTVAPPDQKTLTLDCESALH